MRLLQEYAYSALKDPGLVDAWVRELLNTHLEYNHVASP